MKDVVIVSGSRTPVGAYGGSLKTTPVARLGALVIRDSLEKVGLRPVTSDKFSKYTPNTIYSEQLTELEEKYNHYSEFFQPIQVDQVILGNVLSAGLGQNVARQAMIQAGIPKETSATAINKLCASGMEAVALASQAIRCGDADVVIAGGMENMSQVPYTSTVARWEQRTKDETAIDLLIQDGLHEVFYGYHIGVTAENIAREYNISREEQDEYSILSHNRAMSATENGFFSTEIVPVPLPSEGEKPTMLNQDEIPADMTAEKMANLHPAFQKDGTVTSGNGSGINDGAAALLLMSSEKALELALKPIATIRDYSTAGVDPAYMGLGPIPAIRKILDRNQYAIDDFDCIELDENFAAQAIACIRALGLRLDRTNIQGGSISIGHPMACSGARIILTLATQMAREEHGLGLASLCAGGGQGMGMVLERH